MLPSQTSFDSRKRRFMDRPSNENLNAAARKECRLGLVHVSLKPPVRIARIVPFLWHEMLRGSVGIFSEWYMGYIYIYHTCMYIYICIYGHPTSIHNYSYWVFSLLIGGWPWNLQQWIEWVSCPKAPWSPLPKLKTFAVPFPLYRCWLGSSASPLLCLKKRMPGKTSLHKPRLICMMLGTVYSLPVTSLKFLND